MSVTYEEILNLFRETDRQLKETGLRFQETDRLIQEISKESERKFQEMSKETDRQIQEVNKALGRQGNRLGEFVEEMVRPGVLRLLRERQLPVHQVMPNMTAYDDNGQVIAEVDLLAVNREVAVAVECKSHLSGDDVKDHLELLAIFKGCFPQYSGYQLLGAVAGMVVPDQVGRQAYRSGLFVLAQSGNAMEIRNDARFVPKAW
ncbi:hypothetical protein Thiowin_04364 [Thiorhodovibrio winogradskyi]|uniref:DUF3782 domain-containing protein n=1 Tax=Thiorhodovibrio winogradskyi TaxID=77007 RepID=A0ABZ0SFG3_9GAMM|nr:DUF3782 domain-containing protein [Thiorhodovibrio winogradskyi]